MKQQYYSKYSRLLTAIIVFACFSAVSKNIAKPNSDFPSGSEKVLEQMDRFANWQTPNIDDSQTYEVGAHLSAKSKTNDHPKPASFSLAAPDISTVDEKGQYFNSHERRYGVSSISAAHQQNALAVLDDKIFAVYYNEGDQLVLARRKVDGDIWTKIIFPYRQTDPNGHRTANIAISPNDNKVHIIWGQHADELNYIVSKDESLIGGNLAKLSNKKFTQSLFSERLNRLHQGERERRVTYPRFVVGNNNNLLLFYRGEGGSGNADSFIHEYKNGKWSAKRKIIDGKSGHYVDASIDLDSHTRNAYFNDIVHHSGRIHLTWTWREKARFSVLTNHDLMHAYSEDNGRTWFNHEGKRVGDDEVKINLDADVKFKTIPIPQRAANQCGQTVDSHGNVHMVHLHDRQYHYYRWNKDKNWTAGIAIDLPAHLRPKVYLGPNNTLLLVAIAEKKLRVYSAQENDNWSKWRQLYSSDEHYSTATGMVNVDKLMILAQRTPSNTRTAQSSAVELLSFDISATE